jgi:hypothetical protein
MKTIFGDCAIDVETISPDKRQIIHPHRLPEGLIVPRSFVLEFTLWLLGITSGPQHRVARAIVYNYPMVF